MDATRNDAATGVKDILRYLIKVYQENEGKLSPSMRNKFVKNELGFRVHKSDVAPLVENEVLEELKYMSIVTENGDIFDVDYDSSTLWFTIK